MTLARFGGSSSLAEEAPAAPPPVPPIDSVPPAAVAEAAENDFLGAIERLGGDPSIFAQLVELYLADEANQLRALQEAFAARDGAEYTRAAHSLKGVLASLGATSARELLWQMEQAGRLSDWARAEALLEQVPPALQALDSSLQAWLQQHAGGA